ncbi:MAG: arginine repressor [Candidatus Xenobia bacterium]
MSVKRRRQHLILDIVREESVGSQTELVDALGRHGVETNQATVSRDIQELGLVKLHQRYALPDATPRPSWDQLAGFFREHVTRVSHNESVVLVRTPPGRAHMVAVALDAIEAPEILGTVAGDDTIIVIPASIHQVAELANRLRRL